jgi:hypothetical protein
LKNAAWRTGQVDLEPGIIAQIFRPPGQSLRLPRVALAGAGGLAADAEVCSL